MTVKEVICDTLRLIGRPDTAEEIEDDSTVDETLRMERALLTYLNAVRDELARGYFPLIAEEAMHSDNGAFAFADFTHIPHVIKRVCSSGKPVKWRVYPDYLIADAHDIEVRYAFVPAPLKENDEFTFPNYAVSEKLIEYGMAAEFFLVTGDNASSLAWENKYRNEIENLLSHVTVPERIPPRRWI